MIVRNFKAIPTVELKRFPVPSKQRTSVRGGGSRSVVNMAVRNQGDSHSKQVILHAFSEIQIVWHSGSSVTHVTLPTYRSCYTLGPCVYVNGWTNQYTQRATFRPVDNYKDVPRSLLRRFLRRLFIYVMNNAMSLGVFCHTCNTPIGVTTLWVHVYA